MAETPVSTPASPSTPSSSVTPNSSSPAPSTTNTVRDTIGTPSAPAKAPQKLQAGQQSTSSEKPPTAPINASNEISSKPAELYDVKIDGKSYKMTLEELKSHASMSSAAQKRFADAAQIKKQSEGLISKFKGSPMEALLDPALGYTKDQIRTIMEDWYTKEFIEPTKLTPEQLRLRDAEARVKKYEEQEKAQKARDDAANMEKLTSHQRESLQKDIIDALDKSNLPKTKYTVGRMAYWMQKNIENNFDAPMSVIVKQVQREQDSVMQSLVNASDGDALIGLLGEETVNKIRKYDLARLMPKINPPTPVAQERAPSSTPSKSKEDDKTSMASVSKNMRRLIRTGNF